MRTYDISLTISQDMTVWPGDPPVVIERVQKMEEGASANVSGIEMSLHTGTHVDAPYHFLGGNTPTADELSLKLLTGRAYVLQIPHDTKSITAQVLQRAEIPPRTRRLLFKTRNSEFWAQNKRDFHQDFVSLSLDGAQYLVERGVKLVGIDYLSVAPYKEGGPIHETLLKAGVVIVEGLNLSEISQGRYALYCLPLKIKGVDGAPARAILVGV